MRCKDPHFRLKQSLRDSELALSQEKTFLERQLQFTRDKIDEYKLLSNKSKLSEWYAWNDKVYSVYRERCNEWWRVTNLLSRILSKEKILPGVELKRIVQS